MTRATISGLIAPNRSYVRLVWPLSFAQLVSWGAVYYSFTLFLEPMEAELGVARTDLTGALTLGLLISGIGSLPVVRECPTNSGTPSSRRTLPTAAARRTTAWSSSRAGREPSKAASRRTSSGATS